MPDIDPTLAKYYSGLYVSGYNNGIDQPTADRLNVLGNVMKIHQDLLRLPNDQAFKEYQKLDPRVQQELQNNFPESGQFYLTKPKNWWVTALEKGGPQAFFKSPFNYTMGALQTYTRLLNTPYNVLRAQQEKPAGSTLNVWQAGWDGTNIFEQDVKTKLDEFYGKPISDLVTGRLQGKTVGEILYERGGFAAPDSDDFVKAVNIYFNKPDLYKEILEDYRRAQVSPGRDLARTLIGPSSIGPGGAVEDAIFTAMSGTVDAVYQIATDPLTYATLGVGTAVTKGSRLAKIIEENGPLGVGRVFDKSPEVVKYWDEFGKTINALSDARQAGNTKEAARLRDVVRTEFRDYDDDPILNRLVEGKVFDGRSARNFFEINENWYLMIHGRTQSVSFYREKVALSSKARKFELGFREKVNGYFNGRGEIPDTKVNEWLDEIFEVADEGANNLSKSRNLPVLDEINANNLTIRRQLALLLRNHPGTQAIIWGENFAETLPALRSLVDITVGGDKALADRFAEVFSAVDTGTRKRMLQGVYTSLMYKLGLHRTDEGIDLMQKLLERSFSDSLAVTKTVPVSPQAENIAPQLARNQRSDDGLIKLDPHGAIHAAQESAAVSSFPFVKVLTLAPKGYVYDKAKSPWRAIAKGLGGMTNQIAAQRVMNTWAALTLLPTLGIRSAIDEGFFGVLSLPLDVMKQVFLPNTDVKKFAKLSQIISGNKAGLGPVKSKVLSLINKNPTEFFSDLRPYASREELLNRAKQLVGDVPAQDYKYFRWATIGGGQLIEGMANSMVAKSVRTSTVDSGTDIGVLLPPELQKLLDEEGLVKGGFTTLTGPQFSTIGPRPQTIIMRENANFIIANRENVRKIKTPKAVYDHNPTEVFFSRNALETSDDWANAIDDLLRTVGVKVDEGATATLRQQQFSLGITPNGTRYIVDDEDALSQFLKYSGETSFQKSAVAEVSDIDIAQYRVFLLLQDMYNAFHGAPTKYNKPLFDKVVSIRNEKKGRSFASSFQKIEFEDYEKLVDGYRYPNIPEIRTSIYPELYDPDPKSWFARFGIKLWDAMDRQVTDLFRSDAVMAFYLKYMRIYDKSISATADNYMKLATEKGEFLSREVAEDLAGIYWSNIAAKNAANRVLSYVDNPNVRSNLSYSLRTVGRFYRATEDFMRRIYRLGTNYPIKTAFTMRLMTLGLENMGAVHRDSDGRPYVLLPMDDLIYNAVDMPIRVIMGDKYSNKVPRFVDFPLKLQFLNPSFQEDAGLPMLSGPIAAMSVKGAQGILGTVFGPQGEKLVGSFDDYLLGEVANQPDWWRLVVPSKATRAFEAIVPYAQMIGGDIDPEEMLYMENTSTVYAALSYMMANPDKNPAAMKLMSGQATEKDAEDFLDSARIAAHNVKFIKNFFGFFFAPLGSQESVDLHSYQLKDGVVSPRQEWIDLFVNANKLPYDQRPENPIEYATAMFIGENPNKLIYTVSRNEKTDAMLPKVAGTKNFILDNKDTIANYGGVAFIFAPQSGEFDIKSYQYLEASGLIKDRDFKEYLHDISTKRLRQAIFDSEDQLNENLAQTTNPYDRKQMIDKHQEFADFVKAAHPRVKAAFEQNLGNSDELIDLKSLEEMVADPKVKITAAQRSNMNLAISLVRNGLMFFSDFDSGDQDRNRGIKIGYRDRILDELETMGASDPNIRAATDSIFRPLIELAVRQVPSYKP